MSSCVTNRSKSLEVSPAIEHQARPFYERHGYQRIGTQDGYPPGSRHFHLAKRLAGG